MRRDKDKVLRVERARGSTASGLFLRGNRAPPRLQTVEVITFERRPTAKERGLSPARSIPAATAHRGVHPAPPPASRVVIGASANKRGMASWRAQTRHQKPSRNLRARRSRSAGSTQEAIILRAGMRMEGMSIKDIQPIRLQFSDRGRRARARRLSMRNMWGAETAAGISLAKRAPASLVE